MKPWRVKVMSFEMRQLVGQHDGGVQHLHALAGEDGGLADLG